MDEEKSAPPAAGQVRHDENKRFQSLVSDPHHSVNPNAETIPEDLKPFKQWVDWKYMKRGEKFEKPPVVPSTGRQAAPNNPEDWDTFEAALNRYNGFRDTIAGLGFMLTDKDPFCAIDLDKCLDPETGEITSDVAAEVVKLLNSYTEISPRGRGLHIFIKGKPGNRRSLKLLGIEIFFQSHYITVTGAILDGRDTIHDRQAQLDRLIANYSQETTGGGHSEEAKMKSQDYYEGSFSDEEVLEKARSAKNADKFNRLWDGDMSDYSDDHSSADMALCTILAYWTKNKSQIDRIFRTSTLIRLKWDEKHSSGGRTYGQMTIDKAIAYTTEDRNKVFEGESITAAELMEKDFPEPKWAIEGILTEGLAILAGKPKIGKSIFALEIALSIAMGEKALGKFPTGKGKVLYYALEDSERRLKDRIRKQLPEGSKAPSNLVFKIDIKTINDGGLDSLDHDIKGHPGIVFIIIDTLVRFRAGAENKRKRLYDQEYEEINSIKTLADRHQITILLIHHLRKMESDDPMEGFSGTYGLTGAADTQLVLTKKGAKRGDAMLHITGRDIEEDEIALEFDPDRLRWQCLGSPSTLQSTNQQQVLFDALRKKSSPEKPLSPQELEKITGLNGKYIRNTLPKLMLKNPIKKADRGKYCYIGDIRDNTSFGDINGNYDNEDIDDN